MAPPSDCYTNLNTNGAKSKDISIQQSGVSSKHSNDASIGSLGHSSEYSGFDFHNGKLKHKHNNAKKNKGKNYSVSNSADSSCNGNNSEPQTASDHDAQVKDSS